MTLCYKEKQPRSATRCHAVLCRLRLHWLNSAVALSSSRPALCYQRRMPLDPRPSLKDVRLSHLSRLAFYDQTRMPLGPRPSLNDVCLSHLSRPAFYDQPRMPLGHRPSLNDVCLLCLSRQVFCDQTRMPLDLDTRSRTIALAVSLCFAVLVLRFDVTRFPLPLLTQIFLAAIATLGCHAC